MTLSDKWLSTALRSAGFLSAPVRKGLYVTSAGGELSPAYIPILSRKNGKLRLGGGVGLYFGGFEMGWRASLAPEERRNDATLPLITLLDNFSELIGTDFFEYTDSETSLQRRCETIYEICNRFPRSIDELDIALSKRQLVGKPLAEFVHVFDYHDDRDLYFRKSVEFTRWLCRNWPSRCPHLLNCLTDRQRHRIAATLI